MGITEYTFDNGLKLVYQRRKSSNISAISLFCRVGSNYEPEGLRGVSHFIEHMLFKGTTNIPNAKDIARIFDVIGAYFNAYTDKNKTCYVVKGTTGHLEKIIHTLSDMLTNSLFDKTEFEREKKVVVEEINRAKDNAAAYTNEEIYRLLFKGSSLSLPIGALPEDILAYDRDRTLDFFENFYKPSNMVISICTNEKISNVIEYINKSYLITKEFTPFENRYSDLTTLSTQNNIRIATSTRSELEQTHIALGFRTCNIYSPDSYVLDILKVVLAGNMSSRLFTHLREKNGLVYNVSVDNSEYENSGMFTILTSVDKTKLISYLENDSQKNGAIPIIIDTLNNIVEDGITEDELEKAKGFLEGAFTLEHEDSVNISDYNGNIVCLDKQYLIPIKQLHRVRYNPITLEDVNETAKKYFKHSLLSVFLLGSNVSEMTELLKTELKRLTTIPDDNNSYEFENIDTNTQSETPSETPSETSSETPSETATEEAPETQSETSSETPSETATEVKSETPSETATEEAPEVKSETPSETPTEEAPEVKSETPSETPSQMPTEEATETKSEIKEKKDNVNKKTLDKHSVGNLVNTQKNTKQTGKGLETDSLNLIEMLDQSSATEMENDSYDFNLLLGNN